MESKPLVCPSSHGDNYKSIDRSVDDGRESSDDSHLLLSSKPVNATRYISFLFISVILVVGTVFHSGESVNRPNNPSMISSLHEESLIHADDTGVQSVDPDCTRPGRPQRGCSWLNNPDWNTTNDAINAIEEVQNILDGITSGDELDILGLFTELASAIGQVYPLFGTVGMGLGILSYVIPPEGTDSEDVMLTYMNERFDVLEEKLNDLSRKVDQLFYRLCEDNFATWEREFNQDFKKDFGRVWDSSRSQEKRAGIATDLKVRCARNPPRSLIDRFEGVVKARGTGSKDVCFNTILNAVKNRVGYFEREWVAYYLAYMSEAVEYEGMCWGLRNISISEADGFHEEFETVRSIFQNEIQGMYQTRPAQWIQTLDDEYSGKCSTAECLLGILKDNFFPDYKYAVTELDKNISAINSAEIGIFAENKNSGVEHGRSPEESYGSFYFEKFIVWWKSNNAVVPGTFPRWVNDGCGNGYTEYIWKPKGLLPGSGSLERVERSHYRFIMPSMCYQVNSAYADGECRIITSQPILGAPGYPPFQWCKDATREVQNAEAHSNTRYETYVKRGAVLFRTKLERCSLGVDRANFFKCRGERWQERSQDSEIVKHLDPDSITVQKTIRYETEVEELDWGQDRTGRTTYELYGIADG